MGRYKRYKEELGAVIGNLASLEKSPPISIVGNKDVYDSLIKRKGVLEQKIATTGHGIIFRFQTEQGRFYLINVDEADIPEIMEDIGVSQYLYNKIQALTFLKSKI